MNKCFFKSFLIIKILLVLNFNIILINSDDSCKNNSSISPQQRLKKHLFCNYKTKSGEIESVNGTILKLEMWPVRFDLVSMLIYWCLIYYS